MKEYDDLTLHTPAVICKVDTFFIAKQIRGMRIDMKIEMSVM